MIMDEVCRMSTIAPAQRVTPFELQLPLEAGDHLDQMTFYARYEAMPIGTQAQLVGGQVYIPSPVRDEHATFHADVMLWLGFFKAHTAGVKVSDKGTVILANDSEPQPDAALRIVTGGQTSVSSKDYVIGCPELVCEVASSSASYDLHEKLADYERYGAQEYVAVLVLEPAVHFFRRSDDGRLTETPPEADGIYRSITFPGLWMDAAALLRGDSKRVLDVLSNGLSTPQHAAFTAELASRVSS